MDLTFLVLAEFVMETQISEIDPYITCDNSFTTRWPKLFTKYKSKSPRSEVESQPVSMRIAGIHNDLERLVQERTSLPNYLLLPQGRIKLMVSLSYTTSYHFANKSMR